MNNYLPMTTMANEIINNNEDSTEQDIHKNFFELFNSKEPLF